jgi:hypothetical protein
MLLQLPGGHWFLVDCHLTKHDGTFDRFFQFVEAREIRRLEFIVLTHPDIDHFLGMTDVLKYFTSKGRSVGYWCDSGANSQQVRALLPDAVTGRRYAELQGLLDDLDKRDLIRFYPLDRHQGEIGPAGLEGRVDVVPVAPDPGDLRRAFRRGVARVGINPETELAANPLSVVLILCLNDGGERFQLLLGADPATEGLEAALVVWGQRAKAKGRPAALDAVKVPHHGSVRSHSRRLCNLGPTTAPVKVAVVSAGTRTALPERTVLADYLDRQWTVLLTTTRGARSGRDHFFRLAGRRAPPVVTGAHDIRLLWSKADGLNWQLAEAQVRKADLRDYDRAAR